MAGWLRLELLHVGVPAVAGGAAPAPSTPWPTAAPRTPAPAPGAQAPGKLFTHYNTAYSVVDLTAGGDVRVLWLNQHAHVAEAGLLRLAKLGEM